MVSRAFSRATLDALIVLGVAPGPAAAAGNGAISGTISDQSGGVIPGATVTIMNVALGTLLNVTSDEKGLYSFPSLPVGRYDLTIELVGFKSQKRANVAVDADSRL